MSVKYIFFQFYLYTHLNQQYYTSKVVLISCVFVLGSLINTKLESYNGGGQSYVHCCLQKLFCRFDLSARILERSGLCVAFVKI